MNCLLLQIKGESKRVYLGIIPNGAHYILPQDTSAGYFTFGRVLNPGEDLDHLIIKCHNTQEEYIYDTGRTFKLK